MRRPQRGFTLIELIVTIAILGILAALAAISMRGPIENASAVSASEKLFTMFSQARSLALTKQSQVVILVDMDDTSTSSGHGGIYEILDPDREFLPSKMGSWSVTYSAASGSNPVTANTSIWSNSPTRARVYDSVRFTSSGLAGHVKAPLAADITKFDSTALTSALSTTPWPLPSATSVAHAYSGFGCSFCSKSAATGIGYVIVHADGTMALSDPDDVTTVQVDGSKGYLMLSNARTNQIERALFVATPTALVHAQGSL